MRLKKKEQGMLDGKSGAAVQKAMEILVALGECYDAEELIPVGSAHIIPCNPPTAGKGGTKFYNDMAASGAKCVIPATTNPACLDPFAWQEMGFGTKLFREQESLSAAFAKMGAYLCHTCVPYLIGHAPRTGEHVAWGESSAVVYVNAVLGGRTNREGAPSALASALTALTPAYGFHLPENRYGTLKIKVEANLSQGRDYATLGYYTGKIAQDRVPIFTGISSAVSQQDLIWLSSALASSGSVGLFHIVGVTPEAPTEKMATGSRKIGSADTFVFGPREKRDTDMSLSKIGPEEADLVILGCPHVTIGQVKHYAEILSGRRIKENVEVWILVQHLIKRYAEDLGYLRVIEAAGARLVSNLCPSATPAEFYRNRGCRGLATDSPKAVYMLSGGKDLRCHYGSLDGFVEAITRKGQARS